MLVLLVMGIGVLASAGVWLLLRQRSFDVVLGLALLSHAANLFILAMGRVRVGAEPIVGAGGAATLLNTADPLPQALVLTAIVIGLAMSALLLGLALRAHAETGSDHVDGEEPR